MALEGTQDVVILKRNGVAVSGMVVMNVSRWGAVFAAGCLAALFAVCATASAQTNCDWYGRTALKQQQDNDRWKCGLKGASWTFDLRAHVAWCASVGPDLWKAEARKRERELAACAKK